MIEKETGDLLFGDAILKLVSLFISIFNPLSQNFGCFKRLCTMLRKLTTFSEQVLI